MNSSLAALSAYSQFIIYHATPSKDRPGKIDKIPVDYRLGNNCNPLAQENWTDQKTAIAAAEKFGKGYGVGFVLTANDPFFCLDIDNCLLPDNNWSPFAHELVNRFPGAAVEVSQSGKGLHIWGCYTGTAPAHGCRNGEYGIELYTEKRFIALGCFDANGNAGADCTVALTSTIAEYFPATNVTPINSTWNDSGIDPAADDVLIKKMLESKDSAAATFGGKASFSQLWNADVAALANFFPDAGSRAYDCSRADAALAQHLAYWTNNDCEQMRRLMLRSALRREKYDRADYLQRTILNACSKQLSTMQVSTTESVSGSTLQSIYYDPLTSVNLVCAADIKPQAIRWLWPSWLAKGKLAILAGVGGTGKTTVAMSFAATLTTANCWPDGVPCQGAGNVLIWSSEDDPADTLIPRLIAAGADLKHVHIISGALTPDGEVLPFDPARDIPMLTRKVSVIGGAAMLIVDPIVSAVSGDMHKANDVRRSLQALVDFAAQFDCAVIGISHFTKGSKGVSPAERVIGSQAFSALARLVLVCAKQEDSDSRVLARAKSNISKDDGGLAYTVEEAVVAGGIGTTRISWGEIIAGSARDILGKVEDEDTEGFHSDDPIAALRMILSEGLLTGKEAVRLMGENGFSSKQVRRAREKLGVITKRSGFGKHTQSFWHLPNDSIRAFETHSRPSQKAGINGEMRHEWDGGGEIAPSAAEVFIE